jgi:phage terminase large subunit-like protein
VSAEPFTLQHFREWVLRLELDNGEPWRLEPFQEAFVEDLFTGKPVSWLVIPQGNGKTTLVGGLALYHIAYTRFASLAVAAATRDQAMVLYGQAVGFVVRSGLEGTFRCLSGYRRILCKEMNSTMQVFSADANTGDGIIPTGCIVDELHRHKDLELYRTWRGKLKKRRGQLIVISTAGEPGGEFEEQRERMRQMADELEREETFTRARGASFVLHDWSVPEDGDADDLELVAKANPLSAVTVSVLREERESPDWNLQHWRRLTCNLPTRSELAAITEDEWFSAQVDDEIPEGEPVDVGIDFGWKADTTAIQPLWCRDADYRLFDQGVTLVPPQNGNSLHPDQIKHAVVKIHARNPIRRFVIDISNAYDIAAWIEDEFSSAELIDRGQSNKFHCEDYERFMEALRQGWLHHTGDQLLTRHVLNAVARPATYGDLRFDRPSLSRQDAVKQKQRVIDRLTAAAMVHTSAAVDLKQGEASFTFV